ncbi:hypothetical protein BASA83_006636 [Batrachochytrium salamandrivorans]|nr:hypothetical protein BASA83_006636 [Batrachochytrium salamandrivorans]
MQFFYLFSFVVAASYAAALPQPAELSEKHSNNVNATLASGLEARFYQPGLNSYKESATLMLLERRDDSAGSSEEDSESDLSPLPDTTPNDSEESSEEDSESGLSPLPDTTFNEPFSDPFTEDEISSENLASTINRAGDSDVDLFKGGELAGQRIGGTVGGRLARYLRRAAYVNVALSQWSHESVNDILSLIRSNSGEGEHFEVEPGFTKKIKDLEDKSDEGVNAMIDATSKIAKDDDSVIENVRNTRRSFKLTFTSRRTLLRMLISKLRLFKDGRTLELQLDDVVTILMSFLKAEKAFW